MSSSSSVDLVTVRSSAVGPYSVRFAPLYGKSTPKKFDHIPTDELDIMEPAQFIVLKKRFKLIVTTTLSGFKVLLIASTNIH